MMPLVVMLSLRYLPSPAGARARELAAPAELAARKEPTEPKDPTDPYPVSQLLVPRVLLSQADSYPV